VTLADAEALAGIYNYYVTETEVSLEEEAVPRPEMARRIEEAGSAALPWLVAELDGRAVGYAHASRWKGRCAYRFSVEISVYVERIRTGQGIGSRLYEQLFATLRARGVHAVIGSIALPNAISVALHEKFGLRKVGHFTEVGFKFGRWIDVGYWHRTL
jgi:phosphinothricin acetyltransferase